VPATDPDDELRELWNEAGPTVLARCAAVRAAAADLEPERVTAAHDEAHKLAGAVGMFGFVDASSIAIELDDLVRSGALEDGRHAAVGALAATLQVALEAGP
jgi:HPt (histidine-containing phosphotransfer) domain-containing protein